MLRSVRDSVFGNPEVRGVEGEMVMGWEKRECDWCFWFEGLKRECVMGKKGKGL